MFSTAVRGGKAFAAEQKIRELKKRISRLLILGENIGLKKMPKQDNNQGNRQYEVNPHPKIWSTTEYC